MRRKVLHSLQSKFIMCKNDNLRKFICGIHAEALVIPIKEKNN